MEKSQFEIDFLADKANYYLSGNPELRMTELKEIPWEKRIREIALYRIDEISFEDKAPRKEALENVLSAMRIEGVNFIYLILGNEEGVHFYYGVARDFLATSDVDMELSIHDIGQYILEPGIKGNFRGSRAREVEPEEKRQIIETIDGMKYYSMLEGVPGYTKEDERFQGVDRLVDVMLGDTFGFMIIASSLNYDTIKEIEENLYEIYTRLTPFSKRSVQDGKSTNEGESKSKTTGRSTSLGENHSETSQNSTTITDGTNKGENWGSSKSTTKGKSTSEGGSSRTTSTTESGQEGSSDGGSKGKSHSEGRTIGKSTGSGTTTGSGTSESVTEQTSSGRGTSSSVTIEYIDKKSEEWIKYLNDVIIPRLDYGMGKGIFLTTSFLFATSKARLKKLENTAISLYSGEKGNKVPLRAVSLENKPGTPQLNKLKNFQIPCGTFRENPGKSERISRSALSQFVGSKGEVHLGNWITTNELAMIAGLPQKDVVGLGLREEVEFGLNFPQEIGEENRINLGKLVQSGNVIDKIDVFLDKESLDKHLFITGVTGSGKTTTCQNILVDSKLPFLVIEPAKTEYRILSREYDDLLVFTLGKDTVAPFRLNPFEFFPHESITSRVDMILASIEASFDMEAAIPQLIESSIYECYKDYGWNIATNKNDFYKERAFDDGVYAFPTLEDLVEKVNVVVERQGFDDRLKNDYIGSIRARLQGLLIGSKGLMLNTRRSVDFEELLSRRVVLEFEEIRSTTEKSLIMGFVLTNLMEAIKARFLKKGVYAHVTLVEEAHRLLSKYMPGDSPNKKHGVEIFADMLAEIRKYGESLIIVDQIPNKLTSEVLKNTNTKIVHRLFAEDDKNAIGNTIVLNQEQKEFLSNLEAGRAIVFSQGFSKAVQVQIARRTDTTGREQVREEKISQLAYQYYARQFKRGIVCGSQFFEAVPSVEEMKHLMEFSRDEMPVTVVDEFCKSLKCKEEHGKYLKALLQKYSADFLGKYLILVRYLAQPGNVNKQKAYDRDRYELAAEFVQKYAKMAMEIEDWIRFKDSLM